VTTLFVSPSGSDHAALQKIFSNSNWSLHSAFTCEEARAIMRREPIAVVICDQDLPDGSWRCLLEGTEAIQPPPKVIVSSREVNEYLWADVLRMGGYDLLPMPWEAREVRKVISLGWRSWVFACRESELNWSF
jgi:DNA-binding NtrC family response regulator